MGQFSLSRQFSLMRQAEIVAKPPVDRQDYDDLDADQAYALLQAVNTALAPENCGPAPSMTDDPWETVLEWDSCTKSYGGPPSARALLLPERGLGGVPR